MGVINDGEGTLNVKVCVLVCQTRDLRREVNIWVMKTENTHGHRSRQSGDGELSTRLPELPAARCRPQILSLLC